ncbi:MAG: hypothetical protein GY772_21140 [bacterium]|nr:hypothetical protein [bacterium]
MCSLGGIQRCCGRSHRVSRRQNVVGNALAACQGTLQPGRHWLGRSDLGAKLLDL